MTWPPQVVTTPGHPRICCQGQRQGWGCTLCHIFMAVSLSASERRLLRPQPPPGGPIAHLGSGHAFPLPSHHCTLSRRCSSLSHPPSLVAHHALKISPPPLTIKLFDGMWFICGVDHSFPVSFSSLHSVSPAQVSKYKPVTITWGPSAGQKKAALLECSGGASHPGILSPGIYTQSLI